MSANPTGPLHAGGGRWVAVGDAIANLLAAQGAEVHREYYLNDAGNQLATFRDSLYAALPRRAASRGRVPGPVPRRHGRASCAPSSATTSIPTTACEWGYRKIVAGLQDDLGRIGVHFDTWFSERDAARARRRRRRARATSTRAGVTYERDGATLAALHRLRRHARSRARPLATARTTYLCNDLAYHRDKFARGFTHLIDIWGADHHGQVKSLQAGMRGARLSAAGEPEILLGQFVKLVQDGNEVRISKRTGNIITLADILDEVDPDVARMTFLLQGIDSPQTFDLDIVTAQSMENPVYYVQYAHARIASIGRKAAAAGCRVATDRDGRSRAARARARGGAAARARAVSRRRRGGRRDACAAEGDHVGARLRARASTASTATAACSPTTPSSPRPGCGSPKRAGSGSPTRSRSSACTRRTRWRASTTIDEPEA